MNETQEAKIHREATAFVEILNASEGGLPAVFGCVENKALVSLESVTVELVFKNDNRVIHKQAIEINSRLTPGNATTFVETIKFSEELTGTDLSYSLLETRMK